MDDSRFNDIFNEDFDGNYDNVMNRIVDHINYPSCEGSGASFSGAGDDSDGNNTDDSNDDSDDDVDDDSDGDDAFIIRRHWMRWLTEVLRGHWKRSVNMFRMDATTLLSLCTDLETHHGLKPSRRMSVIEKVAMFLFTIAVGASNRQVQERFQHSGETISRCFKEVLKLLRLFAVEVIKPVDPQFTSTPREIAMNRRFIPHFKNCVGAIDGTHVRAFITAANQIPFIGRKGVPTQNVMATCSFDMQFMFVWAGWEGSAHDTRIFVEAIDNSNINFPKPLKGKYYLVDAGYPNEYGYLGPYKDERWKILQNMPAYPYKTQVEIVVASMALHNYIRRKSQDDTVFSKYDRNPNLIPNDFLPDIVQASAVQGSQRPSRMDFVRDGIANSLMEQ
nr:protein ALP1-like [Populus alba]